MSPEPTDDRISRIMGAFIDETTRIEALGPIRRRPAFADHVVRVDRAASPDELAALMLDTMARITADDYQLAHPWRARLERAWARVTTRRLLRRWSR